MGVSKNRGTPKWMVYDGKSYKSGSFGGTIIFGNTHIGIRISCYKGPHGHELHHSDDGRCVRVLMQQPKLCGLLHTNQAGSS